MRSSVIVVFLIAALPGAGLAQNQKVILTNEPGVVFTDDKGNIVARPDEGGFLLPADYLAGPLTVITWYGAFIQVEGTKGIAVVNTISDLTANLKANPDDASLYKYRGIAHQLNGNYEIAIADFTESLRLNPKQADVYTHRGYTHFLTAVGRDRGRFCTSIENLWLPEANFITNIAPLVAYFQTTVPNADFDLAINDYDRALRRQPESAWTLFRRAEARLEKWNGQWLKIKYDFDVAKKGHVENENKAKVAKDEKKSPEQKVANAQQLLDDGVARFAQADQDLANAKDAWSKANKDLSQANKEYFPYAKGTFERVTEKLKAAQETWESTREAVADKYRKLAVPTNDKTEAEKDMAKTDKELADAKSMYDSAIVDLRRAIADFDESLRREPNASAKITAQRSLAATLLKQAQQISKSGTPPTQ